MMPVGHPGRIEQGIAGRCPECGVFHARYTGPCCDCSQENDVS